MDSPGCRESRLTTRSGLDACAMYVPGQEPAVRPLNFWLMSPGPGFCIWLGTETGLLSRGQMVGEDRGDLQGPLSDEPVIDQTCQWSAIAQGPSIVSFTGLFS